MILHTLPTEIFIDILLNVDGKTLGACRRVCKKWRNIIDSSEYLWEKICCRDFPHAAKIAKEKSHSACIWYYVYKNLTEWNQVLICKWIIELKELDFSLVDFIKGLTVEPAPLRVSNYNRLKFTNNDYALVIFYKLMLGIVRPVDNPEYMSEKYFQAMGFSLYGETLYFYQNKDIFACDLLSPELDSRCIYHCDYDIKEITHFDGKTFVFTNCGKIVSLSRDEVSVKPINCPPQWIPQIRHICAINDNNYICYSRDLFNIQTDRHRHLYLEFKVVTALFFYGDNVLVGDKWGYILLYRPSDQKLGALPITEELIVLPLGQYAVQLDVAERKSGTIITITTLDKIYLLEINFYSDEKDDELPLSIKRLQMYKRVLDNRKTLKMQNMGALLKGSTG